jgi:DNA-binding transcriptional LysR family regulator
MHLTDRRVKLVEEGIDVAIRVARELNTNDVARKVGASRSVLVAAPGYLARHGAPLHPSDLQDHECLTYTGANAGANWQFVVKGRVENVSVSGRIQADNGESLMQAVIRGLGIAYLPEFIVCDLLWTGKLVEILAIYSMPGIGIYAVLPGNRHIPQRVRILVEFVSKRLGAARVSGTPTPS